MIGHRMILLVGQCDEETLYISSH